MKGERADFVSAIALKVLNGIITIRSNSIAPSPPRISRERKALTVDHPIAAKVKKDDSISSKMTNLRASNLSESHTIGH